MKCWKKSGECEAVHWTGYNPEEIVPFLLSTPEVVPMQLVMPGEPVRFKYRNWQWMLHVGDYLVRFADGLQIYSVAAFEQAFTLTPPAPPVAEVFPKRTSFMDDLTTVLNRHCAENDSNTPDCILAEFLNNCLAAWNRAVRQREDWYNVYCSPSHPPCDSDHRPVAVQGGKQS